MSEIKAGPINVEDVIAEQIAAAQEAPVEETVVEEKAEKRKPAPEDEAAYIYQTALPTCLSIASNMKRNELYRVFANFVQFPIVDYPKKLRGRQENELFALLLRIASAKNTLMQHFQQEIAQAETEAVNSMTEEILKSKGDSNESTTDET